MVYSYRSYLPSPRTCALTWTCTITAGASCGRPSYPAHLDKTPSATSICGGDVKQSREDITFEPALVVLGLAKLPNSTRRGSVVVPYRFFAVPVVSIPDATSRSLRTKTRTQLVAAVLHRAPTNGMARRHRLSELRRVAGWGPMALALPGGCPRISRLSWVWPWSGSVQLWVSRGGMARRSSTLR